MFLCQLLAWGVCVVVDAMGEFLQAVLLDKQEASVINVEHGWRVALPELHLIRSKSDGE